MSGSNVPTTSENGLTPPPGVPGAPTALTLDDILDLRAYERVRDRFRKEVMAVKRDRRISVGPIMTLVFENAQTVRFQIQEMARAEKIVTDEGIMAELEIYNRLLPAPGELSATLFIELTSDEELRRWLPRLMGVERAVRIQIAPAGGGPTLEVTSVPEEEHERALSRDGVTSAVHYLRFPFTGQGVDQFADGRVALAVAHPEYQARTELSAPTRQALLVDLHGHR